jgi:hypothetical protein
MVKRVKRNTRKGTRKASRKASRRSRRQRGGQQALVPADVSDASMQGPSELSSAQGKEYNAIHAEQHGGGGPVLYGAPVGTTGVLDAGLRETARVIDLDRSVGAIQGMSDQSGGARGKRSKRAKRSQRRVTRGGSSAGAPPFGSAAADYTAQNHSKGGGQAGGAMPALEPSDYRAPTHLLPPAAEAAALKQMNTVEWQRAADPTSYAPKMYGGGVDFTDSEISTLKMLVARVATGTRGRRGSQATPDAAATIVPPSTTTVSAPLMYGGAGPLQTLRRRK